MKAGNVGPHVLVDRRRDMIEPRCADQREKSQRFLLLFINHSVRDLLRDPICDLITYVMIGPVYAISYLIYYRAASQSYTLKQEMIPV